MGSFTFRGSCHDSSCQLPRQFAPTATIVRHNCQSSFLAPCERIASQSCVALLPMPVSTPAATSMVVTCNRFREYKRKIVGFGEGVIQAGSINQVEAYWAYAHLFSPWQSPSKLGSAHLAYRKGWTQRPPFLAMAELKQAWLCSFGLSKRFCQLSGLKT